MLFDYRDVSLDNVGYKKNEDKTIIEYDRYTFTIVGSFYPYHHKYIVYAVLDYVNDVSGMIETIYLEDRHFNYLDYEQAKRYIEFLYISSSDLKTLIEMIKKTNSGDFKVNLKGT